MRGPLQAPELLRSTPRATVTIGLVPILEGPSTHSLGSRLLVPLPFFCLIGLVGVFDQTDRANHRLKCLELLRIERRPVDEVHLVALMAGDGLLDDLIQLA